MNNEMIVDTKAAEKEELLKVFNVLRANHPGLRDWAAAFMDSGKTFSEMKVELREAAEAVRLIEREYLPVAVLRREPDYSNRWVLRLGSAKDGAVIAYGSYRNDLHSIYDEEYEITEEGN